MLELTVKTLDSQNHYFTVPDETTVRQLKESILEKLEVPIDTQRLIFHGKVLQDEKKLTDYGDVNGKVIHLVQRAPPSAGRPSTNSSGSNTDTNSLRGAIFGHPGILEGSNATYLGAMAFPADLMDAQGMIQPPPSQGLSRSRLIVASRMLSRAAVTISSLENEGSAPAESPENPPDIASGSSSSANDASVSDHPEDVVAVEVEVGGNSDERAEGETNGNNEDADVASSNNNSIQFRRRAGRTSALAGLFDRLDANQRRFLPLLRRCHQLMVDDPSFNENSSPNAEECQRLFNGVSETMHHLAHAYHALSDIMVDFNEDVPRTLRCRPVLIQHSAILETGFPIQAQINVTTRRANVDNTSTGTATSTTTTATNTTSTDTGTNISSSTGNPTVIRIPPFAASETSENSQPVPAQEGSNQQSDTSGAAVSTNNASQTDDRQRVQGGQADLSGFFPGTGPPGNVEFFMDFGPEGITLGSFETTVVRGNGSRSVRNNGGGIQMGNLGPRPPPELLQAVHAVAGQIQNQILGRVNRTTNPETNASSSETPAQPPTLTEGESNVSSSPSESSMVSAAESTSTVNSSQSRTSSTSTPVTVTHANPLPRPHVHLGPALQGIAASSYDPFLPCNSHHIRSPRNRQRGSQPEGSRSDNERNQQANSVDAPQGATAQAAGGPLSNSVMTVISQLLGANRAGIAATRAFGPTPGTASVNTATAQRLPRRRNVPSQSEQNNTSSNLRSSSPILIRSPMWDTLASAPASTNSTTPAVPNAGGQQRMNIFEVLQMELGRIMPNFDGANMINGTIADFLISISDYSYVEGESIATDFFMSMARHMTWPDVFELSMGRRPTIEALVNRLRPALIQFVNQRLLQGEPPSEESIARACEHLYSEMQPYIEATQEARLRESIDLTATINNYNRSQWPEMIAIIVDSSPNNVSNFGRNLTRHVRNYFRDLVAIIIHCCQDGNQGFDTIVQSFVRHLTRGVPEELQHWTVLHSVNNLRSYTSNLNVPLEDIQRYLVHNRIPPTTNEVQPAPELHDEPMELDSAVSETVWTPSETIPSPEKVEETVSNTLVAMDTENLPDVLLGSEAWHNALPSDWVPIIARDSQRQRRQNSQKPFSDAYLSSMPPKRRKLIAASKPQGNLSQVISDGLRHAITNAGVTSPITERVVMDAGRNDFLQEAYKEQERVIVSADLKSNPDFSPNRFPNAFKYFDK